MRLVFVLFALAFIASCQSEDDVKKIDHGIFLHDKSSKVWLIEKKLQGEKDFTPLEFEYREIVVFHKSGNAYFHKLNTLGKKRGLKMTFTLDWKKRTFVLENSSMTRRFKVNSLGRERFVITSNAKDYNYQLVLIPFPEY